VLPSDSVAAEFQKAIALDRCHVELRVNGVSGLAVLNQRKRKQSFRSSGTPPDDMLTLAQLGLMRLGKNDVDGAMKLLDRCSMARTRAGKEGPGSLAAKSRLKPRQPPYFAKQNLGDRAMRRLYEGCQSASIAREKGQA